MLTADLSKTRHVELILRQIDALPTLPVIATKLLALTASQESHARQVVELIRADPALSAKILALCRSADVGIREETLTVDRAVVLLGFSAVRNAVLSIKVFETFEDDGAGHEGNGLSGAGRFARREFWRHSLAVAIAAQMLAQEHGHDPALRPDEAFICGLLHDIGKLALDHVLPKSFEKVVELSELNQTDIAQIERRVMGIDHHTAGKRLAEQWQLPHRVQDVIWLHGSAYDALPRLEHKRMIGLVSLADLIARRCHVGYSGNFSITQDPGELAAKIGLEPALVDTVTQKLHEELEVQGRALGLDDKPSRQLFLQSIQQANEVLGRLNLASERRARQAARQAQVLDAIGAFHASATPGRSVQDVLDAVAASAAATFGQGFYAIVYQPQTRDGESPAWLVCQYGDGAQPVRSEMVEPPPGGPDLAQAAPAQAASMDFMGVLPWVTDFLMESRDVRHVKLLPINCAWGVSALLLHDRQDLPAGRELGALLATWGAAIAAARQHEGARRLGEDLAEANRALADAQDRLLHSETMARLGEMAAGAAHEMNNPLAIISGRSQLLAMSLPAGSDEHRAAMTVVEQSHKLSDLIRSLHLFADPPRATRRPVDLHALIDQTVRKVHKSLPRAQADKDISVQYKADLVDVDVDAEKLSAAFSELLYNAVQSQARTVHVTVRLRDGDGALLIQVSDDGEGMDAHTLAHAMDPFFSAKSAGRRMGMGLPRAQQWAAAHNGRVELRSTPGPPGAPGSGTVASLMIPLDPR